jgi:hypothetical protein
MHGASATLSAAAPPAMGAKTRRVRTAATGRRAQRGLATDLRTLFCSETNKRKEIIPVDNQPLAQHIENILFPLLCSSNKQLWPLVLVCLVRQ